MTMEANSVCDTYGIKCELTSVKNLQVNAMLEQVHQVIMAMLRTSELNMAASIDAIDIDTFLTNVAWATHSTYHTVLKASSGTAIFGWDMLFDIPFLAGWNKIGDYRQCQTDLNTEHEKKTCKDWDYKVSDKVCYGTMASSANQKVVMNVILGLSNLFIQMAQLGFNTEQNQNY
jgi:hypothetical protein